MEAKDQCENLQYLSTCHRKILEGRFAAEWRALTFTLAYYILPVATIFNKDFSPPNKPMAYSVLIFAHMLVAIVSIGFLRSIHKANSSNRNFAERAEDLIEDIIKGKNVVSIEIFHDKVTHDRHVGIRRIWAWWWEMAIILVFAILSSIIVLCK
jgi:hypothetical protein